MADILVYALHYEGSINKNSLGAVSEAAKLASELGGEAHAVVVGEAHVLGGELTAGPDGPGFTVRARLPFTVDTATVLSGRP